MRFFIQQDGKFVQVSQARFKAHQKQPVRLGDRVAAIAQPIARALDRALGTKLAECGGCKKRQEALNRLSS